MAPPGTQLAGKGLQEAEGQRQAEVPERRHRSLLGGPQSKEGRRMLTPVTEELMWKQEGRKGQDEGKEAQVVEWNEQHDPES